MKKVFALVDCNNFYVSCERLFDPKSRNVPAVVYSNNEGCIIARSNEAKRLGLKMGEPVFKCKEILDLFDVRGYSTNFVLYKDLSERVMRILEYFSPMIQVYSVDEAFLDITDLKVDDYESLAKRIKDEIYRLVGIPISIGIAPTKTLAKVASKLAKKRNGFCVLLDNIENELTNFPINDVWGIGFASTKKLKDIGVNTALQYIQLETQYVLKHFNITGLRTWWELKGESSISLLQNDAIPKSMAHTRTFKSSIEDFAELKKKLSYFATSISSQLREQNLECRKVLVFVRENRFAHDYFKNMGISSLEEYTNLRTDLTKAVHSIVERIYRSGKKYKKAGVIVTNIKVKQSLPNLFYHTNLKKENAEKGVDMVNGKWGHILQLGSEFENAEYVSHIQTPHYTTDWQQLRLVS